MKTVISFFVILLITTVCVAQNRTVSKEPPHTDIESVVTVLEMYISTDENYSYEGWVNGRFGEIMRSSTEAGKWEKKNKSDLDSVNATKSKFLYESFGYPIVVSGANFQVSYDKGVNSITWTDLLANDFLYSNKAFKDADYKFPPPSDDIYGNKASLYSMNWQLIKSNEDQSERIFRNCHAGLVFEVKKMDDNLHLLLTLTQFAKLMKNQTIYFMNCK